MKCDWSCKGRRVGRRSADLVRSSSLDAVTSGQDAHEKFAFYPLRIRREVEDNSWTPATYTANGINDLATIAGSYDDGNPSGSSIRPCLYVAHDLDNNGKPDLREILQARLNSTELDENGNWLLDWAENDQGTTGAENMRAGLHAPGFDGRNQASGTHLLLADNVQIVRHLITYDNADLITTEEAGSLLKIVTPGEPGLPNPSGDCTQCENFHSRMIEWGTWDGESAYGTGQQREIVIAVRNPDDTQSKRDVIPFDSGQSTERTDKLNLLRAFAFRWAHCIDYIQIGNESFEGTGAFLDGPNGTQIMDLHNSAFTDLLADAMEWIEDQAETVRVGSALAGRPLRLVTPGFPVGTVNVGADGDVDGPYGDNETGSQNKRARAINDTIVLGNDERMFFDIHLHYKRVAQAQDAIASLDDSQSAWGQEGNLPALRASLEFGPKAEAKLNNNPPWLDADRQNEIARYYDETLSVDRTWDDLIKDSFNDEGWEAVEFKDSDGSFKMADLTADLFAADYGFVCYSPSLQRDADTNNAFNVAALRAGKIEPEPDPQTDLEWKIEDHDHFFTPLLSHTGSGSDGWEEVISTYTIDTFEPHCSTCGECDVDLVCPGCGP